jgi:acyl-coenzyme A thioesterase PaaI-like protein
MFSQLVCWKAPYFGSIRPRFVELRPGYCEVRIKKRWAVLNHIGTVHAIAMCNMAEIAGGIMTDVTIPTTHRWIPKGMSVEYLKKAETDLRAVAALTPIPAFEKAAELPVTINILDAKDQVVCRAVITMWVSPKK